MVWLWFWGRVVVHPLLTQNLLLWPPLFTKKKLRVVYNQLDNFSSLWQPWFLEGSAYLIQAIRMKESVFGIWMFASSLFWIFYVRLWLKHILRKVKTWDFLKLVHKLHDPINVYVCVCVGVGVLIVNKCLRIWQNLVLQWVISMTWLRGFRVSGWPSFASRVLLWLPLPGKKKLRVVQDQFDHVCSLIKTAWGMEPTGHLRRSAKVESLLDQRAHDKDVSFAHIWYRYSILSNSPVSWPKKKK